MKVDICLYLDPIALQALRELGEGVSCGQMLAIKIYSLHIAERELRARIDELEQALGQLAERRDNEIQALRDQHDRACNGASLVSPSELY